MAAEIYRLRALAARLEHLGASADSALVICALEEIQRLRVQNVGADVGADVGAGAVRDVIAERRRQVEAEGWTPKHDDEHDRCEMATAAACYITAASPIRVEREWVYADMPKTWPWAFSWWKPGFYRRNLVKAGALIIAEIERWDRAEARRLQAEKCGLERGSNAGCAEIPSHAQ